MLELKSVDAGYGTFQALFGVNLEVKAGEAVGVIGPNGAGKTTLMRVISGLIRPTKGAIAMEGNDVLATPAHRIVDLGIAHVPENRRLFPRLTVDDNLKMGAYMPGARAKYAERLEFVFDLFPRMKERRSQMAGTMSGGEQQMCAIGRALMSNPKLLLLDEPSAGLAPVVVQQVFELVKRIRASGLTVLIVEQNVQQVLKVVDRAYLLEAGTIRASGTSEEMMSTDTIKQAYLGCRAGHDAGIPRHLRHLSAGSRGQRHPARRRAGAAGARAQSDLRRHRRHLDLLRRTGHDRHVRHVLHGPGVRPAVLGRRAVRDPAGRSAGRCAALHRHRAAIDRAADQPVARHRRRAVHPAELCHRRLRHRLPQSRHPPAGAGDRRDAFQLLAAVVLCRGADRHGGDLPLHEAHLHRAPRSAPSRRTARSCR